jgi:hypothetical protein
LAGIIDLAWDLRIIVKNHTPTFTQTHTREKERNMVAAAGALVVKMVIAAFAGMGAATICHPLDVIRVQMQTEGSDYKSPLDCATQVYQKNGFRKGLYAGISAAYLRQWLYGSVSHAVGFI